MNAEDAIEEIGKFMDQFHLKTNTQTSEDLILFIEDKWQKADAKKYENYYSSTIIGRMFTEYINTKDFNNLMRWIKEYDLFDPKSNFSNHPNYIENYYKGECCLRSGNEEVALEYFKLCHAENTDYIFSRNRICYEFFNKHLETPRELPKDENEDEDDELYINLPYWHRFFKENNDLCINFLNENKKNEEQQKVINYIQEHQEQILKNILTKLLEEYPKLQRIYEYPEEDKPKFMPNVTTIEGFSDLLSIHQIYVLEGEKSKIGFLFSCSWDDEHGLGVMTYKTNVENIGGADTAFS